ncbi:MAG: hypothetical protein Kow00124_04840 [Anaerolineae bacterium]
MDLTGITPEVIFLLIIGGAVLLVGGIGIILAAIALRLQKANRAASEGGEEAGAAATPPTGRSLGIAVLTFLATLTALGIVTGLLLGERITALGPVLFVVLILASLIAAALSFVLTRLDSRDPEAKAAAAAERTEAGHKKPNYVAVFFALAILTAIEIAVTLLPVFRAPILAALATGKIVLVAMYYMHLRSDSRVFTYTILVPIPFVVLIMAALLLAY